MTFGQIKTFFEQNLIESYTDKDQFKVLIREFKENVLSNKSYTKLFSIYEQLSTPMGLSEEDAILFVQEGINMINNELNLIKLPKSNKNVRNEYQDIDNLVYTDNIKILERVVSKKNIIKTLMSERKEHDKKIELPIKTTLNIANKVLGKYIHEMDDESKKMFYNIITEDKDKLNKDYFELKNKVSKKLNNISNSDIDSETKKTIQETINKLETDKFNYVTYLKIKDLDESI